MTEVRLYKVEMPLRIIWGKGKTTKFTFNLNPYRNAHHQVLARAKREYTDLAVSKIYQANIPKLGKVNVLFRYFPRTKIRTDLGNVCSIHDKFFMDALVRSGVIADDNYNYVTKTVYQIGHVDPQNPRMEIYIKEVK